MLRNYLTVALRNLRKHPGYTFINITGLAIGITCCLLILLYVRDELSYDRFHPNAEQVYRIVVHGKVADAEFNAPVAPYPMGPTLKQEFPEVIEMTRAALYSGAQAVRKGDLRFIEERIFFADSTFFRVLPFPLLVGDADQVLDDPQAIVLTETMARKYFGDEDPVGKTLIMGDTTEFRVTGIAADVPSNSHMHFDMVGSLESQQIFGSDQWLANNYVTYLVLPEGYDPADLEDKLPALFEKYAAPQLLQLMGVTFDQMEQEGSYLRYNLQALTDIHLRSHLEFEIEPNGNIVYVYIFSAIAVFILLIACINFMNLATARSAGRAREVGVRKVLGSHRRLIVLQFLAESTLLAFIALLLSVILVAVLLPSFNDLAGKAITFGSIEILQTIPLLIVAVLLVGALAGMYPAFFLSAFKPVLVLKGGPRTGAKGSWLRATLVVFQFAISIALIVSTIVVQNQLRYIQNKSLGFDKEHIVVINRADALGNQQEAFKQEVLSNPNIVRASYSTAFPGNPVGRSGFLTEGETEGHVMSPVLVDHDYIETIGLTVVEGRAFSRDFPSDTAAFVLNEAAVKEVNWMDGAVGKRLIVPGQGPINVIGVVRDFHYASLHQAINPLLLALSNAPLPRLAVRIRPENISGTLAFLEGKWTSFVPNQPFTYTFLDETFGGMYRAEEQLSGIFGTFALLAIVIACLGLFGLASFMAEQRTKEIGVRKAMGASVSQIVVLFSKEFGKLVLIAFVIAAPVSYLFMNKWLEDFAYRMAISWWTFLLAGAAALVIAWVTVGYQSFKAANTDPVTSLRYE